jgi:signal transduction histidine kinase
MPVSGRKIFFLLLINSLSAYGYSQSGIPDSLQQRIDRSTGIDKAAAYYDAVYYSLRNDVGMAKKFILVCDQFAQQEKAPDITAYAQLNHGVYYSAIGQADSAIWFLEKAKSSATGQYRDEVLIKVHSSLGRAYISDGNPEAGLKNLFDALRLLNSHPDLESQIKVRINIGWAYLELKRYQECVNYIRTSLPLVRPPYEWMLPFFYNNMAVSYGALNQLDSAKQIITKSIKIAEATQQFNILANAHFILGNAYANAGKYELAAMEYLSAKPYREKMGDVLFLVSDLYVVSDLYFKMHHYQKGIETGLEALRLAKENNLTLKYEGVYLALAKNYEGAGDFKNASRYYNLLASAKDTVYQHANTEALAEMQTKYETEKKEQQISLLNSENQLKEATIQRNSFMIVGLAGLVLLISFGFYFWRYRDQQKQKAVLQEQKVRFREAQMNAVIDSQEKERRRFASDLHDGMGQLISALQLSINSIRQNREPENRDSQFENSELILSDIHTEIRNIAFNLMPPVLIKEGLIAGLNELMRRINKAGSLKIKLIHHDLPARFSEVGEISLYRIIQELLSNIVKHSSATEVTISFTGFEDEVVLTIEDNGDGYSLEKFQHSEGNGWRNINSRVNLIKANIDFDVMEGRKNNTVVITIPVVAIKISASSNLQENA